MGSAQSYIPPELTVTAAIALSGAVAVGYIKYTGHGNAGPGTEARSPSTGKKGGKKKKNPSASLTQEVVPTVVVTPIVPGGFSTSSASAPLVDANVATTKSKKGKKKKKPSTGAPGTTAALDADNRDNFSETSISVDHPTSNPTANNRSSTKIKRPRPTSSSSSQLVKPLLQSSTSISVDTDSSWTRVESRSIRRQPQQLSNISHPSSGGPSADASTSDAGPATSFTGGSSSPIAERTEDEASTSHASEIAHPGDQIDTKSRRERPDKTSDHATRVHRPLADEKPAVGFSWADYEDVQLEESLGGGNDADADADGEDDGWGVVKSKGRSKAHRTMSSQHQTQPRPMKAAETTTQKQRQNAAKREALKALRAEEEAQRLATLAKHREEGAKVMDLYSSTGKGGKVKGKAVSGGMSASVDEHGKLVWS